MRRIALCLFGLTRSFEKIWPLILENFILKDDDILDIFVVTSNYNNHKYRFKTVDSCYIDIAELESKIKNIIGDKLKSLEILDERKADKSGINKRFPATQKKINVLTNFINYQSENNLKYELVIMHRMDILFVKWKTADQYYEDRKVGEYREKGLLYMDRFDFPIGVKNHGCCCIQKHPPYVDAHINLDLNLTDNELICYEDYYMGHVLIDFFICNNNLIKKILQFWINFQNQKYINIKRSKKKLKTIQSYDVLDKKWWLYSNANINGHESQIRLFLNKENVKLKQLRFNQDISVLYIR